MDNDLFSEDRQSPQSAQLHKELARRANDSLRVYNPTARDYVVRWDGSGFMVPNKDRDIGYGMGMAVHPRYIAEKYMIEMTDFLFNSSMVEAVNEENARRESTGNKRMEKYMGGEEEMFSERYRTDNADKRKQTFATLFKGVANKFGDLPVERDEVEERKTDSRNSDYDILASLEGSYTQSTDTGIVTPTEQKEDMLSEISQ